MSSSTFQSAAIVVIVCVASRELSFTCSSKKRLLIWAKQAIIGAAFFGVPVVGRITVHL
ncbi:hypothetical protein [uncultured Bradyrhizobium sp.]|uniref:hypothetical protein n=1 Tax=Bradyrhizobium sp. TaxID=376 RepID=UPI00262F0C61|nr:hypothetical protein [uncultured Bradyrhizobium sp.]